MDLIVGVAPGLLVGVGLVAAGVWVFRIGRRTDENVLRILGLLMLAVGLVITLAIAAILVVFYLWASGGSYYG